MRNRLSRWAAGMSLGILLFILTWWGLGLATAQPRMPYSGGLDRPEDPIVVVGADLPALTGVPVEELVLYAFDGTWQPIPFQIDERTNDITATYTLSDDGLLDANDELVFMAKDAGQIAAADQWPADAQARQHPRYQLAASDPLDPGGSGWTYLYRSTTLAGGSDVYLTWDESLQTAAALSYTASFSPADMVGLAGLAINGNGVDVLDRQKSRIQTILGTFTEEDLASQFPATVTLAVVGPVRGVTGGGSSDGAISVAFYGARWDFDVALDLSQSPIPIQEVRVSFDLTDPLVSGVTGYFDSNGTVAAIDGSPDSVPASPRLTWYQASGPAGGIVVAIPAVTTSGTVSNYYKDDATFDGNDTGDHRSYADTGLRLANPAGQLRIRLVTGILPPGTMTSMGAAFYDRVTHPITVAATVQQFGQSSAFLPIVFGMN